MKIVFVVILLIAGQLYGGEWENFELRENGTIPVWSIAGPFPNGNPGCV